MKHLLTTALVVGATATAGLAQVITPVWVQRIAPFGSPGNGPDNTVLLNVAPTDKLPLLAGSRTEPNNNEDGSEVQPVFVRLQRYDANRLLLFVAENGINESDPGLSQAQKDLAATYPDKSIVWIDANTGKTLGVAFKESAHPAALIGIDVTAPNSGNQQAGYDPVYTFYWRPAVDEGPPGQKALYSGINHLILRYAPLPDGSGWTNIPTVAYAESIPGYGDGLTDAEGQGNAGDNAQRWRWRNLRVYGYGTNTTILAGGGTWRAGMHAQVLVTKDGLTFTPRGRIADRAGGSRVDYAGGGTGSRVVKYGLDPAHPNLEAYFQGHYPAYGHPSETPERYLSDPDNFWAGTPAVTNYNKQPNVAMFESTPGSVNATSHGVNYLPAFQWEQAGKGDIPFEEGVDGVTRYDGSWSANVEANGALDYIVNYSFPSWNNTVKVPTYAWLGIHRLDGRISQGAESAYQIPLTERDVPATGNGTDVGNEAVYNAWVELNPDTTAAANLKKAEILAAFGPLGFGVFTVQNVGATLVASPTNQTVTAGSDATLTAQVTGSPNDFQWYHNGVPVPTALYYAGARKASLTITAATPKDAGDYQLKWNNPVSGAGQTAVAKLTVTGNSVRWAGSGDIVVDATANPIQQPGLIVTNASSFTIKAGGFGAFDKWDSTVGTKGIGENGYYRYESVTGDFDKRVRIVSFFTSPATDSNNAETWARASLMVRQSSSANTPALEIAAGNPDGANAVRVMGRGRQDQIYSQTLSRSYSGVKDNLPHQWLRISRVGNAFSFYVGTTGTNWSLIAQQYQAFPNTVLVGTFAAPDEATGASQAIAEFADYGDVVLTDNAAPTLVSAGTLDKKVVGLKFSKVLDSLSASVPGNYSISQGTVLAATPGVGGDSVYLTVNGLTNDTFTVQVLGGVVDTSGNAVAAHSSASGKKSNWTATDIGYIQDPTHRPTAGDDPYVPVQAVAVSSDTNPEIEIVGGGSNAWNAGDYIEYIYRQYTNDFDVVVAVNRFDRRGIAGGYANAGIHVRSALYRTDTTAVGEVTKVPDYINITYYEGSGPDRAAIEINRPNAGDNYANNNPIGNSTKIGGLLGFATGLSATNAAGDLSPQSSPTQAHWLRVKRTGTSYSSSLSYDGKTWMDMTDSVVDMPNLAGPVLVGFGHQNDFGSSAPPKDAYDGNGTQDTDGNFIPNESNYGVLRISHLGNFDTAFPSGSVTQPTLTVASAPNGSVVIKWQGTGFTLQSSSTVDTGYKASGLNVVTAGDQNTVTIDNPQGTTFYRLIQ